MNDETNSVISTKERVAKAKENKEGLLSVTYHNRKEHYSKCLGEKEVFAIVFKYAYDEEKNFDTIWTTPEKLIPFLDKHRDEIKVYDQPTYID